MSLGGYKFRGYKYTCPADYDSSVDAQVLAETLKMHKCKLKAFTESCAASGAQWDFSYSNGDYAFGTHGNVIYKLDSSGFNLVSFFRYGEEDAYYAIVTLSDAGSGSSHVLNLANRYYFYSGTTLTSSYITNDMCAMSLVDMNMSNINVRPELDRLALMSQLGTTTEIYYSSSIPSERYYGYATKNKCVTAITADSITSGTKWMNVSAIDALSLSSPDDTKNIFSYFGSCSSTSSGSVLYSNGSGYIQILNADGKPRQNKAIYNSTNTNPSLYIAPPSSAVCDSPSNYIPYESASIHQQTGGISNNRMNSYGILSKGVTQIDLLSVNNVLPHTNIIPGNAYANGNYICFWKLTYNSSSTHMTDNNITSRIAYVGWDPSNPDITSESAWTAYTE